MLAPSRMQTAASQGVGRSACILPGLVEARAWFAKSPSSRAWLRRAGAVTSSVEAGGRIWLVFLGASVGTIHWWRTM